MSINLWNLAQTKTSFFIRQRTQAQRLHLNKLKHVKSNINIKNQTHSSNFYHSPKNSRLTQLIDQPHSPQRQSVSIQQNSIIDSITGQRKSPNLNTSYFDNLRVSSSLSRLRQFQQIQKQNCKIIQRLIKAKASISDIQFKKNHLAHLKYKQNILKNKYINPDYSQEVKCTKKQKNHLFLKPIQNLTKLSYQNCNQSRVKTHLNVSPDKQNNTTTKVKSSPKSQNYRFHPREINLYATKNKQLRKS